ncbi:ligase-associated DNA damage response exonuclease [Verrucomicrobia bacterium]|jgi:putative mRNA 3-end processing factor|nr:ligase-associated DNA damage response exonuclease [bacterium]MDB4797987.1 ligase-associated DNA damage response exonuclease [Verrucomicrobiota bacterium]
MLLELDRFGLRCEVGDFYIDPSKAVDRALITHAHADHARTGCRNYLCAEQGAGLLQHRLGKKAVIESMPYTQSRSMNGVKVSFHPSGHVLGASQIRVEYRGEVWVVSGDYKLQDDPTCDPFEAVPCHTFISECTFGLPIYRWPKPQEVSDQVNQWWRQNRREERHSYLYGYSLGKAQRLLAGLDPGIGSIMVHPAIYDLLPYYLEVGIRLPKVERVSKDLLRLEKRGAMVLLPPAAANSKYTKEVGAYSSAFASGWMLIRGTRRSRSMEGGFVVSDHADWPGLNDAILSTGAEQVLLTHGQTESMERWLNEKGIQARALEGGTRSPQEGAAS